MGQFHRLQVRLNLFHILFGIIGATSGLQIVQDMGQFHRQHTNEKRQSDSFYLVKIGSLLKRFDQEEQIKQPW